MSGAHSEGVIYGDGYELIRAASVTPEKLEWHWDLRIPRGEMVVLEGDPGVGKSILSATLVAALTAGGSLPGGPVLEPATCLIANLEDHREAVTRPRLEAAGADLDRAILIKMSDRGFERPLRLPDDLDRIENMIMETAAELLIIDPLTAALPPDVNIDRDQDVRDALGPLAQIGREYGTTILLLRHLNKSIGKAAIHRGAGSVGIGGLARAVLLQAQHPYEGDKYVLTQTKTNGGVRAKGLVLRIETAENGAGRIVWEDEVDLTSDDVLNEQAKASIEAAAPTKRDECEAWLRELLASGPMASKEVEAAAAEAGYAHATLRRARKRMRLRADRVDAPDGVKWVWRLTTEAGNQVAQADDSPEGSEQHGQVEQHEQLANQLSKSGANDDAEKESPFVRSEASHSTSNIIPISAANKTAERKEEREGDHFLDRAGTNQADQVAHVAQLAHVSLGLTAVEQPAAEDPAERPKRFRLLTEDVRERREEAQRDRQTEGQPCPECTRVAYLEPGNRCVPCQFRLEQWRA